MRSTGGTPHTIARSGNGDAAAEWGVLAHG